MNKMTIIFVLSTLFIFAGCKKNNDIISYHKFKDHTWNRFEKIRFEIPILDISKPYDVYFFANHTPAYEFDNLNFNMIMTTPAGEERIKEYTFAIKYRTGSFTGTCVQDSCTASVALKKGLYMEKKGMLKIEIEALVPRLEIKALSGIGIRLIPSGQ